MIAFPHNLSPIIKSFLLYVALLFSFSLNSSARAADAPLKVSLKASKARYVLGEPLFVEITIRPTEDTQALDLSVWPLEFNLSYRIAGWNKKENAYFPARLAAIERVITEKDYMTLKANKEYKVKIDLLPKLSDSQYSLDSPFVSQIGSFSIQSQFHYMYMSQPKGGRETLSNKIEINITSPEGNDFQALKMMSAKNEHHVTLANVMVNSWANDTRDAVARRYPKSTYAPYAIYYQAQYNDSIAHIGTFVGDNELIHEEHAQKSIELYQKLIDSYRNFELIPDAYLGMANAYEALKEHGKARQIAEKINREYPGTYASQEAQTLIERIALQPKK